jgi:hypothetical protein
MHWPQNTRREPRAHWLCELFLLVTGCQGVWLVATPIAHEFIFVFIVDLRAELARKTAVQHAAVCMHRFL